MSFNLSVGVVLFCGILVGFGCSQDSVPEVHIVALKPSLVSRVNMYMFNLKAFRHARRREVSNIVLDSLIKATTTHTPVFLGLPGGVWAQDDGSKTIEEGIVIGFIDTRLDPTHPSFFDNSGEQAYPVPENFSGICQVIPDFLSESCNWKLVGARHFAASAINRGYSMKLRTVTLLLMVVMERGTASRHRKHALSTSYISLQDVPN